MLSFSGNGTIYTSEGNSTLKTVFDMGSSSTRLALGRWKHLVICPDRHLFKALTDLLAEVTPGSPLLDIKAYPTKRAMMDMFASEAPNVCFLDVGSDREASLRILGDLASSKIPAPVVAVNPMPDPDLILTCLREGAREFLSPPFKAQEMVETFERLSRFVRDTGPASANRGKIYCVMPGKGASGATTIATSLAFSLRNIVKEKKVLLADLDPTTGTVSFLLKLRSNYSFVDALSNSSQLDQDMWRVLVTPHQGVDVMLSPEHPVDRPSESYDALTLMEYCRANYGNIVVDTPSPYGDWSLTIARASDELLLVTTNELPTLHACQKALAYLERNGVDRAKVRLLVNRYNPDAGLGREAIETALHLDVFEVLPSDYESVQKSLLEGKPVPPNTSLGKSISRVAERLSGKQTTAKRPSLFSGFLARFESSFK